MVELFLTDLVGRYSGSGNVRGSRSPRDLARCNVRTVLYSSGAHRSMQGPLLCTSAAHSLRIEAGWRQGPYVMVRPSRIFTIKLLPP